MRHLRLLVNRFVLGITHRSHTEERAWSVAGKTETDCENDREPAQRHGHLARRMAGRESTSASAGLRVPGQDLWPT